jgi:hypothetical protein
MYSEMVNASIVSSHLSLLRLKQILVESDGPIIGSVHGLFLTNTYVDLDLREKKITDPGCRLDIALSPLWISVGYMWVLEMTSMY